MVGRISFGAEEWGRGGSLGVLLPRRRTSSVAARAVVAPRLGVPIARLRIVVLPGHIAVDVAIDRDGLCAETFNLYPFLANSIPKSSFTNAPLILYLIRRHHSPGDQRGRLLLHLLHLDSVLSPFPTPI